MQNTALNSPEQQRIVQEQGEYMRRLDACGQDMQCIVRLEKARYKEVLALRNSLQKFLPGDEIVAWTKGQVIPYDKGQSEALGERLMDGFELSPLPHVTFTDGSTLFWGFKQGDGTVQSLAITDGLLLAGVGNKPADAQLHLFVRDPKALDRYLPGVRAWAAADVLGFNQQCPGKDARQCAVALRAPLLIHAYVLQNQGRKKGKFNAFQHPIALPKAQDSISPGLFWQ